MQLTIEVSADIAEKLKGLEQRVNCSIAPTIERELEHPVSIEQVAAVVVQMGLSEASEDKIVFALIVQREQSRGGHEKKGTNSEKKKTN